MLLPSPALSPPHGVVFLNILSELRWHLETFSYNQRWKELEQFVGFALFNTALTLFYLINVPISSRVFGVFFSPPKDIPNPKGAGIRWRKRDDKIL